MIESQPNPQATQPRPQSHFLLIRAEDLRKAASCDSIAATHEQFAGRICGLPADKTAWEEAA